MTSTKSRFLSIFGIVALGVGFFTGVTNSAPDMRLTAQHYYETNNLAHFRLVSTLGFSDSDIAALEALDGVKVYPSYFTDALIKTDGGDQTVRVMSLAKPGENNEVNSLTLTEGRFPESPDECIIDNGGFLAKNSLGEKITLMSGTADPLSDTLSVAEYTVVGIFNSPMYIDKSSRGNTTVGNGSISSIIYVSEANFTTEVYTEVYITGEELSALSAYTAEYGDANDRLTSTLEAVGDNREIERYDEIIAEAEGKISDAETELADKKAELQRELAAAQQKLSDAKAELEDGEVKLAEAQQELSDAKLQLEDSRRELNNGAEELEAQENEFYEKITKAEVEIKKNEQELADGKKAYLAALDEYNAALTEFNSGKAAYDEALSEYQNGAQQLQLLAAFAAGAEEVGGITREAFLESLGGVMPTAEEIAAMGDELAAAETALVEKAAEIDAAQEQLELWKAGLEETKTNLDLGEKSLADARTEFNSQKKQGQAQLDAAKKKLSDGEAAYAKGIEDVRQGEIEYAQSAADLRKGWDEYNDGVSEYNDSKTEADGKIADAEREIRSAKREMSELQNPSWYVYDRTGNVGYKDYGDNADRIDNIAKVFPVFFLLVAVLVCLTTMTRMVEEERVQIGTLKALGYNNGQIIYKYMLYAVSATVFGAMAGTIIGQLLFPYAIMNAYGMLYTINDLVVPINWFLGIFYTAVSAAATALTVYFACKAELSEMPAQLMRPKTPKLGKTILLERLPIWKHFNFTKKVTFRNLFRYKRRMLMTVVGVAGCTALTLTGFALRDSISDIVYKQYDELSNYDGLLAFDSDDSSEIADIGALLAQKGVYTEYYQKKITAESEAATVSSVYIVVPQDADEYAQYFILRDRKSRELFTIGDGGVVIDEKLSNMLGLGAGDTISFHQGETEPKSAVISAVTENYPYHYIYMSEGDYEALFGEKPQYNMMSFRLGDKLTEQENDALASELLDCDGVLNVSFKDTISSTFTTMLKALDSVIIILVISAGLLAFVVLYNLTNINITERIREIATLKVLGFYDKEVDGYIFRENMLLTLMGTAVGLFGGTFLARFIISTAEIDIVMFGRDIYPASFLFAALITVGFSVIVSLYMHRYLKKINMIDALKSVE